MPENLFEAVMLAEIHGVVTCADPCVPECPRHATEESK